MTVLASTIVNRARQVLMDSTGVRWTTDELLQWMTDAQRQIVLIKPDANLEERELTVSGGGLVVNTTRQSLSNAEAHLQAFQILDIPYNTSGRAIRLVDRTQLDLTRPDWHAEAASETILHWCYDQRDPMSFYLYPRPTSSAGIHIIYSRVPNGIAAEDDALEVPDVLANAVLDYVLYRAYTKDADYGANSQKAVAYYQAFNAAVGGREQVEMSDNPNVAVTQPSPSRIG